jgi:hypothetical protein
MENRIYNFTNPNFEKQNIKQYETKLIFIIWMKYKL